MKKLLLIITLLSSFFLTKSQSIQYLGTTTNRVQSRNDFQIMRILYPGLIDTTLSPTQNGAIVTKLSDGQTYNFISNPGGKQWWSWTAQDTLFAKRGVNAVGKFFLLGNPKAIDSAVYFNGGNVNPFQFDSLGGTSGIYFKKLPFKSSILGTDSAMYRDSSGKVYIAAVPSGTTNLSSVATATSDTIKSSTGTPAVLGLAVAGSTAGLLGPNGMTSISNPLAFANYRGVGDTVATASPFNDSLYFKAISPGELMAANTVTQQHIVINCDSFKVKALLGYGGTFNITGPSLWGNPNSSTAPGSAIGLTSPLGFSSGNIAITGILGATNGGTNNAFVQFTGVSTSIKSYGLPNTNATILTDQSFVTVVQGGSGTNSLTGYLKGNGTSPFTAVSAIPIADITGGAPLASPSFTGTPAVPTASPGTNTTQAASTAFVLANAGGTTIYSGNGSLVGDRVLSGASHALSLGSSGNPLSTLLITVSSFSNGVTINGGQLIVNSNILANHFISQGTPSIAIGAGDPGASVSISGTDEDGKITLTTGTSNFGFNAIATITFANSITNSFPVLFPNSSTAALLTGVTQVSTSGTGTTWSIFSGTTALSPSTTYIWYYHVGGF